MIQRWRMTVREWKRTLLMAHYLRRVIRSPEQAEAEREYITTFLRDPYAD